MRKFRWLLAIFAVALAPMSLLAQEAAVITGRVTNATGDPVEGATVRINVLNVGAVTGADGTYRLVVPASRIRQTPVGVTASRIGLASQSQTVTLRPGAALTQNFQLLQDVLELEGLVATGQGTTTTRERLATAVSTVKAQEITQSRESNVVAALAGKAPGVQVTSSAGDPGAGAYIRIRGAASVVGGTQPLFVVDGTPIDNSSVGVERSTAGTVVTNRAADINPNDIESIDILKGAAATAIYGARGANGVVLIRTKSGVSGSTRATFGSSVSVDQVNKLVPLQQQFGQGLTRQPFGLQGEILSTGPFSYGLPLEPGTPTFDHAAELFDTGLRMENNLTLSGGSERTTYYLGVGRLNHDGAVRGNSEFERTTLRLKGTHFFTEDVAIGGNFAYTASGGDFVQQGSNISGLLLGALRTPPEFNNLPYRDPESGLHRSYRLPNPSTVTQGRGYDNPFFIANEIINTSEVGRFFGNVSLDYTPASWLRVSYLGGLDYASDERNTRFPKSSSDFPQGRLIRANFVTEIYDHNLTATATGGWGENFSGSLTVGQNLNQRDFRQNQVNGQTLILGAENTDFTVTRIPSEFKSRVRTDGYFATGEATMFDQLTVNATARVDGSSTFGGDDSRFFYPGVGAAWTFSRLPMFEATSSFLDFAKLRASWGVSGRQPPVFSNTSAFVTNTFNDGWISPNGLESIYLGREGIVSQFTLGNPNIDPERKTEFEAGIDLAFLNQRASFSATYYDRHTEDAILQVPVAPSTGAFFQFRNAAEFDNSGWELTLDLIPVQTDRFSWTIGTQYSTNESCVTNLAGAEDVFLAGFTGSTVSLVSPEVNGGQCAPFGVFYGDDWVRFGRGITVRGVGNIDEAFPGTQAGTVFLGTDGKPLLDPQERIIGDPNPDWNASFRNTITIGENLRISGLVDIQRGGDIWNGTRGALYFFGTHAGTLPFHGAGTTGQFGRDFLQGEQFAGPGTGKDVTLNWATWTVGGLGSGFTGPSVQFIEDASFVKLRDVSVSYTLDQPFIKRTGFTAIDLTVSGRNLKTWTDYTGIDPESNLTGQSTGRGLDYFNNPQTRSWVFTVNLNR